MAYQAQDWTANALSVEFKIDRRTVSKRLEKVKPCRVEGIAKYYLMVDAAPALLMPTKSVDHIYEGGQVLNLDAERARLTKEQADKLERERLLDEERLVPAEAVRKLIERLVGSANARLGAMPAKLAPRIRPDDPVEARRHLELAVEEAREELRRLVVEDPTDADAA